MRRMILIAVVLVLGLTLVFATIGPAVADQPGVECEEIRPGHSENAPGSAFNEDGVAGDHYAGEQPQNSNNPHSVSQYDVACIKVAAHEEP